MLYANGVYWLHFFKTPVLNGRPPFPKDSSNEKTTIHFRHPAVGKTRCCFLRYRNEILRTDPVPAFPCFPVPPVFHPIKSLLMQEKKIVLVTGATGAQGGAVARALLKQKQFDVRIFTRNAKSNAASKLERLGAQVAEGDLHDKYSLETAMENCYGVFGVTDYWEHGYREYTLGRNLLEAAAVSGIRHLVLHTQPDYKKLSSGELDVPQCDIKAAFRSFSEDLDLPATYLQVPFYYENFLQRFPLRQDQFGTYQFSFPQGHTKMAMVSVEDLGPVVTAILTNPDIYLGRTVTAVGADKTCDDYAKAMRRVLELPVQYNYVPWELYRSLEMGGGDEWANLFEVQRLFVPDREREMAESYRIYPGMQPFENWLRKYRNQFIDALAEKLVDTGIY